MRKAIGTMILLAASGAAVMTPAVAAERDHKANANQNRYATEYRAPEVRRAPEPRRDNDNRGRDVRVRNNRRDHNDLRYRNQSDWRR